jgi:ferredoxin-fold anticodon binding domain-containing protein
MMNSYVAFNLVVSQRVCVGIIHAPIINHDYIVIARKLASGKQRQIGKHLRENVRNYNQNKLRDFLSLFYIWEKNMCT